MSIDIIHVFFFLIFIAPYVIMIFMRISYKQQTADPATKNIEKTILALNNEISKMRTESEWKSETQSLGKFIAKRWHLRA